MPCNGTTAVSQCGSSPAVLSRPISQPEPLNLLDGALLWRIGRRRTATLPPSSISTQLSSTRLFAVNGRVMCGQILGRPDSRRDVRR